MKPTLLLLGFISAMSGATYYVAPAGSDTGAGTVVAPFATIQRGVTAAAAGDTVSVANGTYGPNGHYTCGTQCSQRGYSAPVTFTASGMPGLPITIAAQNKWGAVLDCQLPAGYSGDGTDGVRACDTYFSFQGSASWITISGFDIQRDYWVGAMVNATNSHIAFVSNHFHHIGNRIYDVPAGTSSYGIVGVYAGTGSSYVTWDRNQFDHIGRVPHAAIVSDDYSHDHGLYIYNGPYTITNNVFYAQPAGWNVQTAPGVHDTGIINNTMIGGANPQKDGCMMLWGNNTNLQIQNNIFYNGRNYAIDNYATAQVGTLIDHNIIYGSASGLIAAISGSLILSNNRLNTNPAFVGPGVNDYHLQAGSPAIDTAASVSLAIDFDGKPRPSGPGFDVGAYEFSAGSVPVAPSNVAAGQSSIYPRTQINVYWNDNSNNETGFSVYRSTDGVHFNSIAVVGPNVVQYDNPGLLPNTRYYYYVVASGANGISPPSNVDWTITKP